MKYLGIKKKRIFYTFSIDNWEELYKRDPDILSKLESSAPNIGAFVARLDTPSNTFIVFVEYEKDLATERPYFSVDKMKEAITVLGFKTNLIDTTYE